MTNSPINVEVKSFFGDTFTASRVYFIPKYQRPYSWDRKQVEDFWNDLVFALERNRKVPYMMGSIYVAKVPVNQLSLHVNDEILKDQLSATLLQEDNQPYFIIDGQQRVTTLFLLLLALHVDTVTSRLYLNGVPRLVLGKVDFKYFSDLARGFSAITSTMSHRRIRDCYDFFKEKVASLSSTGEIIEFITNNMNIVKIEVLDNLELATSLFISQTDRGKRLTNLEKLKSTLMFYSQKTDKAPEIETEIDDLFGSLFEAIEKLCSFKLYAKAEQAEADVLKIMGFMLLKDDFYNKYLNSLVRDRDRKVEIWYEAGEDRIYESVVKVLRESLELNRDRLSEIVQIILDSVQDIYEFYSYVADTACPAEIDNPIKDPYEDKRWYPFKQLFSILGLSVFSKALLVALHKAGKNEAAVPLSMDYSSPENAAKGDKDIFEKIEKVKNLREKLSVLLTDNPTAMSKDIESIWKILEIRKFLTDRMIMTNAAIARYELYTSKPITVANLIEENELAIWQNNKRPVGSFVWGSDGMQTILDHVRNFSFNYKKDYMIRDLSYANYKYILFEYERLTQGYTDQEILQLFNYDIDEDDKLMIQREHVFPVQPDNYDALSFLWTSVTGETYSDWIWKIGNITLLEHDINIVDAGNKPVWEKAKAYQERSLFKGTKALASEILALKNICDTQKASAEEMLLALKILLEMRELELYAFAFYRFA